MNGEVHELEVVCNPGYFTVVGQLPDSVYSLLKGTPKEMFIDQNCTHNLAEGLRTRVLGDPGRYDRTVFAELGVLDEVARMVKQRLSVPLDTVDYIRTFKGRKGRLYERAHDEYLLRGVTRRDASTRSFVKAEKMEKPFVGLKHPNAPDPRIIQGRGPIYNIALGRFLKPIEEIVYNLRWPKGGLSNYPIFGKSHNSWKRGGLIAKKMSRIPNCRVLSLDCSRFDHHVNMPQLKLEHKFYKKCWGKYGGPELQRLLSWQLRNHSSWCNGIVYKVLARRMSGDPNTALGNCILMFAMTFTALAGLIGDWDMYCDGDDTLVFVSAEVLEQARELLISLFTRCGHVLRVDGIAKTIHEVRWCQCAPVRVEGAWRMVRDPTRVLARSLILSKYNQTAKQRRAHVGSIGECELALGAGCPVLDSFARALLRNAGEDRLDRELVPTIDIAYRREGHQRTDRAINGTARLDFEETWGVTVDEQLAIENALDSWVFDPGTQPTPANRYELL